MSVNTTNCQLRKIHLQIFLSCLIVIYGLTLAKLHLHAIEGAASEEQSFSARLNGPSIKKQFKTSGEKEKSETTAFHSNVAAESPLFSKAVVSTPYNSRTISKEDLVNVSSSSVSSSSLSNKVPKTKHWKDASRVGKNTNSTTAEFTEFTHHEGAVIVTKVHGPHQLPLLKQSMCLLHQAYNKNVRYDILVFTTIPIQENDPLLVDLRTIIAPVELKVILDNDGIVNEIHKLSPTRRRKFLSRCNVTSPEEITWDSECYEEDVGMTKIRYNWQAEFRSWHIWHHEALRPYRYMMWIDTDAFCTAEWDRDPMAIAMNHEMVIYFDNYPQGRAKVAQPRVKEAFGNYLCSAHKLSNGPMVSLVNKECKGSQLWTIHGFHHITNLDFFRQDQVMHWAETMIGDCFLCRRFDDQLAVTVPSMILAPERSWDMYKSGVQSNIFHNHKLDGKRNKKAGGFLNYWKKNAESQFPEAWNKCEIVAGS